METIIQARDRQYAEDMAKKRARREAEDELYRRASQMPENKDVPHTYEQPARRTVYSRDPRICKHQFANGRKVCPYCATTNPEA